MAIDGHIELITGTMFSGKSTELIRRLNRYEVLEVPLQVFKPIIDTRYSTDHVTSHDGLCRTVSRISSTVELVSLLKPETKVVGIDEVQFLDDQILGWAHNYAQNGGVVVASGLLKDFRDKYFPFKQVLGTLEQSPQKTMADFLELADHILQLKALCKQKENGGVCGRDATRVQRYINGQVAPLHSDTVLVGGTESYLPVCRKHFHFYE